MTDRANRPDTHADLIADLRDLAAEIRYKGDRWTNEHTLGWIGSTVSNYEYEQAHRALRLKSASLRRKAKGLYREAAAWGIAAVLLSIMAAIIAIGLGSSLASVVEWLR
jgi:surface antigen